MSSSNSNSKCELVTLDHNSQAVTPSGQSGNATYELPAASSSPNLFILQNEHPEAIEIDFNARALRHYQTNAAQGETALAAHPSSGSLTALAHGRKAKSKSSSTGGLKKNFSNISLDTLADDHMLNVQDFCSKYETSRQVGLTQFEAQKRLLRDGLNLLSSKKKLPKWLEFLKQLFVGFGPLYWVATALCLVSYLIMPQNPTAFYNLVIGGILLVALIGTTLCRFLQMQTATNIMDKFLKMMPHNTRVLRDGKWVEVPSPELVVGDVITLTAGDKFPADVRAIEVSQARIDKSSLTGETKAIKMTVEGTDNDMNETRNVGFFGTNLVEGNVKAVVISIGDRTTMGQLAHLSITTKRKMTTLERDIYYFTIGMSAFAVTICIAIVLFWIFWLNVYANGFLGLPALLQLCTGLIVAFFPEGLAIAVTATLMLASKRMRSVNVVVKDLNIMDTLGATSVICSDKTGTITQNKMALSHLWMIPSANQGNPLTLRGSKSDGGALDLLDLTANQGSGWLRFILGLCGLCNNASVDEQTGKIIGSSTEAALLTAASAKTEIHTLRDAHPMTSQIPFDSARKYQMNVHKFDPLTQVAVTDECATAMAQAVSTAKYLVIVKGGSEIIVDMCKYCMLGKDVVHFTESLKHQSLDAMKLFADRGERVLGLGFCFADDDEIDAERNEDMLRDKMCFLSLLSLVDPPRPGVANAVEKCHTAGVKVMMVTGDHPATACAIARKVSIFTSDAPPQKISDLRRELNRHLAAGNNGLPTVNALEPLVVLGKELLTFTEQEWDLVLKHREVVYARTTPENKLEIVKHYQSKGEIVAATGDGVNDSAALKKAHVGIAMAIAGSEISKEAANVVLMDDNFSSIVAGIEEGRLLFDNLRKVVCYLLPAGCFTEVLAVLANTFLGIPLPLSSFLMIVPCVSSDIIGAVNMVHEPAESDLMKRRPRKYNSHLVDMKVILYDYTQLGVIDAIINFTTYFVVMYYGGCNPKELLFAWSWGVAPSVPSDTNSTLDSSTNWTTTIAPTTNTSVYTYCGLDAAGQLSLINYGQTAYFVALIVTQCWNVLACSRTRRVSILKQKFRRSLLLVVYFQLSIVMFVVYVPFVNKYLFSAPVNWYAFGIPIVMGLALVLFDETRKFINRRYPRGCLAKVAW